MWADKPQHAEMTKLPNALLHRESLRDVQDNVEPGSWVSSFLMQTWSQSTYRSPHGAESDHNLENIIVCSLRNWPESYVGFCWDPSISGAKWAWSTKIPFLLYNNDMEFLGRNGLNLFAKSNFLIKNWLWNAGSPGKSSEFCAELPNVWFNNHRNLFKIPFPQQKLPQDHVFFASSQLAATDIAPESSQLGTWGAQTQEGSHKPYFPTLAVLTKVEIESQILGGVMQRLDRESGQYECTCLSQGAEYCSTSNHCSDGRMYATHLEHPPSQVSSRSVQALTLVACCKQQCEAEVIHKSYQAPMEFAFQRDLLSFCCSPITTTKIRQ